MQHNKMLACLSNNHATLQTVIIDHRPHIVQYIKKNYITK